MEERPLLLLLLALSLSAQAPQVPDLAPSRLEGQVVDAMQQPVGNALVVAQLDGEEVARTQSDATGTFVFAKVPQQFVVVRAITATPDIGAVQVDLLGETRGFARIVLMPARKVTGVVKDDSGKPVAGAWVFASPSDLAALATACCMTQGDANGRYELTHVAMGPVLVRAWAEGCTTFDGRADGAGDVSLDCVVKRGGGRSHTIVLTGASAEQAAAARLVVTARRGEVSAPIPPPWARLRPIGEGRWVLSGWPRLDALHLHLTVPGATVSPARHVILSTEGPTTREFTVGDPPSCLRGKIAGTAELPAVGLTLVVQPLQEPLNNAVRFLTVTQADGTFAVQSPAATGEWFALRTLSPTAVLQGNAPNPAWFLAEHSDGHRWPLSLQGAHTIRARLRTAKGSPASGADVTVFATSTALGTRHAIGVGTTDANGDVEMQCLALPPAIKLDLEVTGPHGFHATTTTPGAAGVTDFGELPLSPAGALFGTVQQKDGGPAAGVRLRVSRDPGGERDPRIVVTDRSGRYQLTDLPPGDWYVCRREEPFATQQRAVFAGRTVELSIRAK